MLYLTENTARLRLDLGLPADAPLGVSLQTTLNILRTVAGDHWVVTFSGGKDSTLVTILAVETFRRWPDIAPAALDIVYADTLVEIPPLHRQALCLLDHVQTLAREHRAPIQIHRVSPPVRRRFWFLILGKGYPPPHRAFWWCTQRLKVEPVQTVLDQIQAQNGTRPVHVLTGVRWGESLDRDRRLSSNRSIACVGQGECGQSLQYHGALAPILHWPTCQVWDFLALYAPSWGWPTANLVTIYDQANIRFGCWACTVVKQERALASLIERGGSWQGLKPLQDFRRMLVEMAANPRNRVPRPDGKPGRFTLESRQRLLEALLEAQESAGVPLISPEEVQAIRAFWASRSSEEHNRY